MFLDVVNLDCNREVSVAVFNKAVNRVSWAVGLLRTSKSDSVGLSKTFISKPLIVKQIARYSPISYTSS